MMLLPRAVMLQARTAQPAVVSPPEVGGPGEGAEAIHSSVLDTRRCAVQEKKSSKKKRKAEVAQANQVIADLTLLSQPPACVQQCAVTCMSGDDLSAVMQNVEEAGAAAQATQLGNIQVSCSICLCNFAADGLQFASPEHLICCT